MPKFHDFLMRHGEAAIQDLLARWERYEGLQPRVETPLEDRWAFFTQQDAPSPAMP